MKLNELHKKLIELNLAEEYYLHGLFGSTDDNDKLSLVIKMGIKTAEYEIYFKERGFKTTLKIFYSEEEACEYFLKQFLGEAK